MANLTQIELPSGSVYDIVDQGARDLIDALNSFEYVVSSTAADTPQGIKWGSVTGTLVPSESTMYKIYLVPANEATDDSYAEYITVKKGSGASATYQWEKFGSVSLPDMSNYVSKAEAGDLAYKDTASGSGTVAVPKTFTTTITPAAKDVSVTGTTAGTVNVTKNTVTISKAASGTATYTPEGSVAAPTISVATAGSTTTIKNPTSKTVVTDMSIANPSSTTATGELVYCSVSGTKLSFKKFVETTGDSITTTNVTVKNGDASYSATAPKFTGTGARLVTDDKVATDASFAGASMTSTGSYTPAAGSASTIIASTEDKTVSITVS